MSQTVKKIEQPAAEETVSQKEVEQVHEVKEVKEVKEATRPWIHVTLERLAEQAFRWIFFWELDEKRLGTLIRFLHHSVVYSMVLLYIFSHTLYPSYWLLVLFTCIMSLIWLQHFLTGGCVVSKVEQKMLGDSNSFVDPILKILGMEISAANSQGLTVYTSSLAFGMSLMEVFGRTILAIKNVFSFR